MTAGGSRADRTCGRAGRLADRRGVGIRTGRSAVLAVSLALVTLISVTTVPVAGAAGPGSVASVHDSSTGGDPLRKGGPPANNAAGGNGGSSGNGGNGGASSAAGGGSRGGSSSGNGSPGGGAASGSDGDSQGDTRSSGESGSGSSAQDGGGSDAGSDGPSSANAGENGNDASGEGQPGHSNEGGNGNGAGDDGPTVSVSAGAPREDRGPDGSTGQSDDGPPPSVVEVSVKGAEAGDDVAIDVSPTAVEDDAVAFDGISITVQRDGNFTMEVTNSGERLPGSPAFEPDRAADSLGRVRLDHSIANDEVEEVSYTFRVSKAHLRATDTDAEDVALFRHADSGWTELPTDVVGETATHYLFSADSPGMSEFAVGAERPDFEAYWADVEGESIDAGETVTVSARVTNRGGADGVYDARLVVDGEVVSERSVTIAGGGTRQVNFRTTLEREGTRRVAINGVAAGEVSVSARSVESSEDGAGLPFAVAIDRLLDVTNTLGITSPPSDGG